jgi:hypothetical protein
LKDNIGHVIDFQAKDNSKNYFRSVATRYERPSGLGNRKDYSRLKQDLRVDLFVCPINTKGIIENLDPYLGYKMYESVLHTLYENINRYFIRFLSKDSNVLKNTYEELRRITNAIDNKDPKKARNYIVEHVRRYYQMMEPTRN